MRKTSKKTNRICYCLGGGISPPKGPEKNNNTARSTLLHSVCVCVCVCVVWSVEQSLVEVCILTVVAKATTANTNCS